MSSRIININQMIAEHFFFNKKIKVLHMYAVSAYVTANYGYARVEDYIAAVKKLCGCSERTIKRWIEQLREEGFINVKKGIIYVKGRKKVEKRFKTTKTYIKFNEEHLEFYTEFRDHIIRQLALLIQRKMSYGVSRNRKHINAQSLVNTGEVSTCLAVVKTAKRTGCSISMLTKRLGTDKMTISRALKGYTEKQFGTTKPIKGKIARKKYKSILDREIKDPRWSFEYNKENDTYILKYALASRIKVDSFLSSKRKSNNKQEEPVI